MKKGIIPAFLVIGLTLVFGIVEVWAQTGDELLKLNRATKFLLKNKEEKVLILNLKKDDFTAIDWRDQLQRLPNFSILSPAGKDISREIYMDGSTMFVAKETGAYKLTMRFDDTDNEINGNVTVSYTNVFKLPKSAKLKRQKKVNGYDVKVYNNEAESSTYLLIEQGGQLKDILKGGSLVGGGFNFADEPSSYDGPEGKKSALLMRNTVDKTGDGTPDVAVGFFTGGAHCCSDLHFYELGANGVRKLKVIEGNDSDVIAVGKQPTGGLILKTGDSSFAYWLTSFAGSPLPKVILTYQNGEFRPDVKLMKKTAPAQSVLKKKADEARKEMDLEPYTDEENSHFLNAFWGEMLDLMYQGNETSAWQYFDLVWDKRKPGKEKFKQDFLGKLNESEYWQYLRGTGK